MTGSRLWRLHLALLAWTICALPLARAQTVEDRAKAAAAAARAKSSDSDAMLRNYVNPGLAGQAITTVDGKQTFNPRLTCQKAANLLEIMAQPASTGDIGLLRISRDADLDGTYDQALSVPVPISGICANGIISCRPGTWDQCRSFKWSTDPALTLAASTMADLAGCYCINNSCGSNLAWGNMASVLKDLGGGVVGALTTADPRIGIAQAAIDGPIIRYAGAQATSCTSSPALAATAYRTNPAVIQGDAFAAARGSSVFQALSASPAALGVARERRACSITREISVKDVRIEDVIARTSGGYATNADAAGNVDFFLGSPTKHSLRSSRCGVFDFHMTLTVGDPDRLRAVTLPFVSADDWAQVRVDGEVVFSGPSGWTGAGLPPGKCERDGTSSYRPAIDLKPYLTKGSHEIWLRLAVADKGNGFAQIHAEADTSCQTIERLVDLCSGYAGDPQCQLSGEIVDGVETIREGVATGLRPLPQTRIFGSPSCSFQFARDFFEKSRTYLCAADETGLPTPDLSRGAYIIDHSTETVLADRTRARDGALSTSTRAFALPERGAVPSCEPVCKTRALAANVAAAPAGVVGGRQNDPAGWDTFYHSCGEGGHCPVGPGEEIVSACGCLDDFPEAIVMMQTLRLGGIDLACTATAR